MHKYIVVGGEPFRSYTGTLSFIGLKVVGRGNTAEEIREVVDRVYGDCGGLLLIIDAETGQAAEI